MTKAHDLMKIEQMVEDRARKESVLHKALKTWVCIEQYEKGIPIDTYEFEKLIQYLKKDTNRYTRTTIDVFIDYDGGLAYYCQLKNDYPWLYKFLEHVPILKKHSTKQFVVFPENLEALFPMRWQQYVNELDKVDVGIISAPFSVPIENKQVIQVNMSYKALSTLVKLKNRYSENKTLINFIEKDLEELVKKH